MLTFVVRRMASAVLVLFAISVLVFLIFFREPAAKSTSNFLETPTEEAIEIP